MLALSRWTVMPIPYGRDHGQRRDEMSRKRALGIVTLPAVFRAVGFFLSLVAWAATACAAETRIRLARPFSDHMVLQQGMKLPIWGTAQPGEEVVVRFGGSTVRTKGQESGQWRVDLPPFQANANPSTLTVESAGEKISVNDILVGEVWLAAGQSNMDFSLKGATTGKKALEEADNANLRFLNCRKIGHMRWGGGKQLTKEERMGEFIAERYFSGSWETCGRSSAAGFAAVAYFFGAEIERDLKIPVGLIDVAVGGTPCESWTRREVMAGHPQLKVLVQGNWLDNKMYGQWGRNWGRKMIGKAPGKVPEDDLGPNHCCKPGFCWEGIRPLIPFAIRGVIWYQAEANTHLPRSQLYPLLFPAMVEDWRRQWGHGDFPFLYVQLPAYNDKSWARMRQMQLMFLDSVPATGMAVSIDVGSRHDIHPKNKEPVGHRLALWALGTVYGRSIAYSGPLFKTCERRDGSLVVHFRHAGTGLATNDGKAPVGFEIAGDGGVFVPAEAKIADDTVVVAADKVSAPVHVRYGWDGFPRPPINLCNKEGLPASPFTTIKDFNKPPRK
jgi:sialate O-acetylesterase